ncbi:MAG: hypothetical protein FWG40_03240 [Peptococcaceae bacterium]|nr:hypothetical protein [Peptococcaceae bacterium]
MDIYEREDIYEYDELEKVIDIKNISFEKLMGVLIGFTFSELFAKDNLRKLIIDSEAEEIIRHYALQGKAFFDKSITKEALFEERISAWGKHDEFPKDSAPKNLLRLVIYFLYDEKTARYDNSGPELYLEAFFSSLLDLGGGYCTQFRRYMKEYYNV